MSDERRVVRAREREDDGWRWKRGWGITMGLSLLVAGVLVFALVRWLSPDCVEGACPSVDALADYRPPEPPQVFDQDGDLAGTLSGPSRIVVGLDTVPEIVRAGYVAVEDRRFYEHGGIDLTGAGRALFRNIAEGEVAEGASTITMQLARNVFGPSVLEWNRWHRKLAEIRLARQMEDQLTKEQILGLYLNQIYLGDGVYGVETAARHYFGKSVADVTTREAALLVGLAKNPEGLDPEDHPEAADERIATVLDLFVQQGVIDEETARQALADTLELVESRPVRDWGPNAYYLARVRRELRELFPEPSQRAGLHIHTGLDQSAQAAAVEALQDQIRGIESGGWGTFRHEVPGDTLERSDGTSPYLQGMLVAMRPESGLVTTLVGGRDFDHSEFDRAFQAQRQPGSAFKPIVYSAALGQGLRLNETVSTDPVRFAQQGSPEWEPDDHVGGEEMTVREALVRSSNTAAVRIGQRVGTGAVGRQAAAMGITTDIPGYPSVYLGSAEVVPVELVAAYATFLNGGHSVDPHVITRVEDPFGRVVFRREDARGPQVVDERIGFLVLDVLRDVVRRGTGWRVGSSGVAFPVAGKTGTTNESRDLWFVGMSPKLVAGVWLGFDDPEEVVDDASGGELAAPVFARFMQAAHQDLRPVGDFQAPPGVTQVRIDGGTGYRVSEDCPVQGEVRTEYFLSGTEPREFCPYRRVDDEWWGGWNDSVPPGLYGDTTDSWEERERRREDSLRRTIFYRGDTLDEERLDSLRRARALDSLRRSRGQDTVGRDTAPRLPEPRDTVRIRTRPDTTRPDTIPPDTIPPDTIPNLGHVGDGRHARGAPAAGDGGHLP